jgi:fumarate reductase subunit D
MFTAAVSKSRPSPVPIGYLSKLWNNTTRVPAQNHGLSEPTDNPPPKPEAFVASKITHIYSFELPLNGRWVAWSQVLGGHIIAFFVWGFIASLGMFQAYYTSNSLSSPSNISWIGSMTIFLLMMIPLWSGAASDLGYYELILRTGILLWMIVNFVTSIYIRYWQFLLAQGACIGAANGFIFVPTMSVVPTYFRSSKRSFAIGLVLTGSATGVMILPNMLNRLFTMIRFGWAVRCFGFTTFPALSC